jgi:glycosyltransferase involved in cell wall biosynthesis
MLVKQCARQLSEYSFVFVGPINGQQGIGYRATRAAKELPNLFFLGSRPQGQLPAYLKSFDAVWMPFKVNELTRSMCPIKMYEYLAAGKSVVSVHLPEIGEMAHVIRIAQDPREIPSYLHEAVSEDRSSAVVAERVKSVQHFSWERRFMLFEELLAEVVH